MQAGSLVTTGRVIPLSKPPTAIRERTSYEEMAGARWRATWKTVKNHTSL